MANAVQDIVTVRPVEYLVTEDEIAATKARYAALDASTPAGYEEVRQAIATVRSTRVAIEKRRAELKAESLEYGRQVDSVAKRLTALVEEIEDPLVAKKKAIDDEKARIKAEQEAAKLKELQDRLAAERAEAEAKQQAEREAERKKLDEERAAIERERAELAELRRVADEEAAERRRVEEARQAKERERERLEREAEAERLRIEREQLDRERRELDAEKARKEAAEAALREAEEQRVAKARREAEIAALMPDAKKLNAYAAALLAVPVPTVKAKLAKSLLDQAAKSLAQVAASITSAEKRVQ